MTTNIETSHTKNPTVDPADREACPGCSSYLIEPFIKCAECSPYYILCLQCFANGFQSGKHSNNHRYEIVTNDFPLLEYGWSSAEEMRLIDGLTDCGAGNWSAIAKQVRTKTKQECKSHYIKCYILEARYPLPELPHRPIAKMYPPIPFKACEDPSRPLPESHRAQDMAGYLAARGDFTEEYLNSAECDIKDVHFSPNDWPVLKALKLAMVKIYQSKLAERKRRKEIIRLHGLVNFGNYSLRYLRRLPYEQRGLEEKIRPLTRLQHPIAHDKMLAGFTAEDCLIKRISKLQEYRKVGITSRRIARLYDKMKVTRSLQPHNACLTEVLSYKDDPAALLQWLQRQCLDEAQSDNMGPVIPSIKRTITPIDVSDLPGVDKLNTEEKQFCGTSRIVPDAYLRYKEVLKSESEKAGCLRLAQARNIVKIDVNKTRKLYDFLVKQGIVVKDI